MRLCIMKQECLNEIKGNLDKFYPLYFSEKTNSWMETICGQDPFVKFGKEIPDFELASLDKGRPASEIDFENCKIVYSNLKFLSESQASDERLWAGLTNGLFYDYMRKRCKYDITKPKAKDNKATEIRSRFFFKGGSRSGFYRNFLAKCWWVGRALYDEGNINHFEKLDILGARDLTTKVSDIFYSNTFASNPEILDGIILFFDYLNKEGFNYSLRKHIRPCMKHLNTIGGAIILDCLSKEEVRDELIDYLDRILIGDDSEAHSDTYEDDDELEEDTTESSERMSNILEELDDAIAEETDSVKLGDTVTVTNLADKTQKPKRYKLEVKEGGTLLPIPEMLMGRQKGDVVEIEGIKYEITNIEFGR